jgi:hypothetical protein
MRSRGRQGAPELEEFYRVQERPTRIKGVLLHKQVGASDAREMWGEDLRTVNSVVEISIDQALDFQHPPSAGARLHSYVRDVRMPLAFVPISNGEWLLCESLDTWTCIQHAKCFRFLG